MIRMGGLRAVLRVFCVEYYLVVGVVETELVSP